MYSCIFKDELRSKVRRERMILVLVKEMLTFMCGSMCVFDKERQCECVLHRGSLTRPAVVSDDCYAAGLKSCQQEQASKGHTNTPLVCAGDLVMDVNH